MCAGPLLLFLPFVPFARARAREARMWYTVTRAVVRAQLIFSGPHGPYRIPERVVRHAENGETKLMAKEVIEQEDGFSDDELVIRKKKAPEMRQGVTEAGVLKAAAEALEAFRARGPLVQCMTNTITSGFVANALLALGATSAVVEDLGEASQFITAADSLLVNVGTATKPQADAMRAAVSHANMGGRPWVLDPAGVGTLPLRTFTARELMRRFPAIIRGNAAEISFLVNNEVPGRAATLASDDVVQAARRLSGVTRAAVLVSGEHDCVAAEGVPLVTVLNGSPLVRRVVGVGCVQGAVAAAFLGVLGAKARWEGALAAALAVSLAGEFAAAKAGGPGSFAPAFLDALYALKPGDVLKSGKVKLVPVA